MFFKKSRRRMDRLRRSLRESFRKRKDRVPECSKPHQWQSDESAVRAGNCSFHVKYLGCVEVYESRGMQVCEEALKVLRHSRRRSVKGMLYVTGDGLRVVDDDTKGLIVDQTIEKVSFCAPDRNHDRGFSYICRDGTTRRWMCHGFLATKEVIAGQATTVSKNLGERLSHAVGCAFSVCLEKKQKRDKECGVQMTFDSSTSTFTRTGSFRQTTITERMKDPQECKPTPEQVPTTKSVHNPYAVQRPHASVSMLERQGSFRGFSQLNQTSPFKRQLSLRLDELPSTLERQQNSLSVPESKSTANGSNKHSSDKSNSSDTGWSNKNQSISNKFYMSPIPESSPVAESGDSISAMCQQVSQELSLLSKKDSQNSGNPWASSAADPISTSRNLNKNEDTKLSTKLPQSSTVPSVPPRVNSPQVRRAPNLGYLRSQSLGSETSPTNNNVLPSSRPQHGVPASQNKENATQHNNGIKADISIPTGRDPFDAEWAAIATRHEPLPPTNTKNPFQQNSFQAFEVHM